MWREQILQRYSRTSEHTLILKVLVKVEMWKLASVLQPGFHSQNTKNINFLITHRHLETIYNAFTFSISTHSSCPIISTAVLAGTWTESRGFQLKLSIPLRLQLIAFHFWIKHCTKFMKTVILISGTIVFMLQFSIQFFIERSEMEQFSNDLPNTAETPSLGQMERVGGAPL